ncbi:hypothetical protein NQ315_016531 [Exocentrus adspersus]|uniref:Endonuclease/exonuclease/phosphatase domain-containing protein n=1 Tax=Exocentrus adspersus TaxID=1586481 RepID=A0AAV8VYQ6_9CUCU|nr:hypothetical protein NQ315_016531 [Exocentrus adspersus]
MDHDYTGRQGNTRKLPSRRLQSPKGTAKEATPPSDTSEQRGSDDERAKTSEDREPRRRHPGPKDANGGPPGNPPRPPRWKNRLKIPPMVLRKQENWSHVSRLLKEKKANYIKAKMIGDNSIAITPATAADHRLITKVLETDKQEYHTYSLQEDRTLRAVIRGIPYWGHGGGGCPAGRDKRTMPLVLVQVPTNKTSLLQVQRCCALVVGVEKQRQAKAATQCHRCQKFGHGQSRCTAQPKCVKCGADHETSQCEKSREEPARCANCSGPHPASYRGCPKYPKPAKKTAEAKQPAGGQTQPPRPSAVAVPGKSFAAAAAAGYKKLVPAAASPSQGIDLTGAPGDLDELPVITVTQLPVDHSRATEEIGRGGGVSVAIKRGIDHYMLQVPQLDTIEAVAVGIRTSRYGEVAVASCYHPPGRTILEQDIEALLTVGPRVIAIGDFNAKSQDWNSRQQNPSGAALRRFLEDTDNVEAIGPIEPTYDGQGRFAPDVLDIALLKAIPAATDITSLDEGSSDHNPVLLTMGAHAPEEDIIVKRNTDWAGFRAAMQRSTAIPRIETTDDLEAAVVSLETDIRTALERSTTETREVRRDNYIGDIPLQAQQLIRDRRAARRRAMRTGAPEHRRVANQLSRRVKAALEEHRQEHWRRFVESLNPDDNSLWKTQKVLRTTRKPFPPIQGETGIARTNRDKAETFADSLQLQCRENQLDDEDEDHYNLVERRARRLDRLPDDDEIRIIFSRRPTQRRAQEVTINGEAIQWSNNVKYLGVHLDRTMTWGHHVAETIRKAKTARGRLYPLLCGDSRLNLRNKLLLIKSVIQPQLTYASTAWGHACNTYLKRIQAVENIALRTATSAPWFVRNRDLYRDLEWTSVQEVIKVKAAKVYAKATDHENPLLRAAVDYEPDRAATHKRPKQQLLDPG